MGWLEGIEKVIDKYIKDTFLSLGLKIYQIIDGPGMGALIKLSNDFLKVQLINDRGIIDLEISPIYGKEQFRAIDLYNSLVELELNSAKSGFERKKILGKRLDFISQANFLKNAKVAISYLLSEANYQQTIIMIDRLGSERFDLIINK